VNTTAAILVIVGVVLIALGLFILMRQRRSRSLRKQSGPEYKHAVRSYGGKRKAQAELAAPEKRVRRLDIRPLTDEEQNRFSDAWMKTRARFVDEPSKAVGEADGLVPD